MEIKELKIYTHQIDAQEFFYKHILGFNVSRLSSSAFQIQTKENKLIFEQSDDKFYYHFAFLIPPQTIDLAIQFLVNKGIELLPYKNSNIIEFNSGRAIYFYDRDDNIVEFIERPTLAYKTQTSFSIEDVIKINEIGMPVENPIEAAEEIVQRLGIQPINQNEFRENFCWVGDYNGVIIVVKKGRNWLPTNIPGIINDFSLKFIDAGEIQMVKFENNEMKVGQF